MQAVDKQRLPLDQALASCQPGQVVAARAGQAQLAVARTTQGAVAVFLDKCPHQFAPLSEGWVEGDAIVCPRHNWEFSLIDGSIVVPSARLGCPALSLMDPADGGLLDPTERSR